MPSPKKSQPGAMFTTTAKTQSVQQQQQQHQPAQPAAGTIVEVALCISEEQQRYLPKRRKAPNALPPNIPIPRRGDVIYLSRSSAWGVDLIVYDWLALDQLRIEVWLKHVDTAQLKESGFVPLQ